MTTPLTRNCAPDFREKASGLVVGGRVHHALLRDLHCSRHHTDKGQRQPGAAAHPTSAARIRRPHRVGPRGVHMVRARWGLHCPMSSGKSSPESDTCSTRIPDGTAGRHRFAMVLSPSGRAPRPRKPLALAERSPFGGGIGQVSSWQGP